VLARSGHEERIKWLAAGAPEDIEEKRMGYHLATATLGPLLLLQGRHVRRVTPRLSVAFQVVRFW
jgi:hypothetical protein